VDVFSVAVFSVDLFSDYQTNRWLEGIVNDCRLLSFYRERHVLIISALL